MNSSNRKTTSALELHSNNTGNHQEEHKEMATWLANTSNITYEEYERKADRLGIISYSEESFNAM